MEKKPHIGADNVTFAGDTLATACHGRAWNNGWWHDLESGKEIDRNKGEICALIHSEVSEAFEAMRKSTPDHPIMDEHLPHLTSEVVEMADAVIRIMDFCGYHNLPIGRAIAEKMDYNDRRADHKPESRKQAGGKKI